MVHPVIAESVFKVVYFELHINFISSLAPQMAVCSLLFYRDNSADQNQPAQLPEESSANLQQPSTSTETTDQSAGPSSSNTTSGQNAIGRTINEIQDSITTMREEYIDR